MGWGQFRREVSSFASNAYLCVYPGRAVPLRSHFVDALPRHIRYRLIKALISNQTISKQGTNDVAFRSLVEPSKHHGRTGSTKLAHPAKNRGYVAPSARPKGGQNGPIIHGATGHFFAPQWWSNAAYFEASLLDAHRPVADTIGLVMMQKTRGDQTFARLERCAGHGEKTRSDEAPPEFHIDSSMSSLQAVHPGDQDE